MDTDTQEVGRENIVYSQTEKFNPKHFYKVNLAKFK